MRAAQERVVEVIAQFDGTIVEVRHLGAPRTSGVTRETKLRLVAAGIALAVTVGMCAWAYTTRARMSVWVDLVASLALVAGAWALVTGWLRALAERTPAGFAIPRGLVDGTSGGTPFPLIVAGERGWELTVTREMSGEVSGQPLAPGVVALAPDTRAYVQLGALSFVVSSVTPAEPQPRGALIDWNAHAYTASCAMAAAVALALLFAIPPDPKGLALDDLLVHQRFPTFVLKPPQELLPELALDGKTPGADKAGGRNAGAGGVAGTTKSTVKNKKYAIAGHSNEVRLSAREVAQQAVQNAGILGIVRRGDVSSIGSIFKPESPLGEDAETAMGHLIGTEIGDAEGVDGGGGMFGREKGGGGTQNTIGLTNLPTIGGSGLHPNYGGGRVGYLPRDKKREVAIEPTPGPVRVIGTLDKEIIRRVVRRHLNEVRFCYEKELLRDDKLFGRIVAEFTIAANGAVVASHIQTSTMHSAAVEACVSEAVKRWAFPAPEHGIVVVAYPFLLNRAGN